MWWPTVGSYNTEAARENGVTRTAWRRQQRRKQLQTLKERARQLPYDGRRRQGAWCKTGEYSKDVGLLQQAMVLLQELGVWKLVARRGEDAHSPVSAMLLETQGPAQPGVLIDAESRTHGPEPVWSERREDEIAHGAEGSR